MTRPHSLRNSRSRLFVTRLLACLPLLATLGVMALSSTLFAADGRDFAGTYQVTNITDLGDDVRISLAVRISNFSAADVASATVTLQDSQVSGTDFGAFGGTVSIAQNGNARLAGEFTVSKVEFGRWQTGGTPSLRIEYSEPGGNVARRSIEMAPAMEGE